MIVCVVMQRTLLIGMKWPYLGVLSIDFTSMASTVTHYPNYEAGTAGPEESDTLLEKDGFFWWPIRDLEVENF